MPTDFLYLQSEKIRPKLAKWSQQNWGVALDFIKKGEVTKIGERDFRIPVETAPPGRGGTYNPDFGDRGRGSGPQGTVMTASYFPMRLNFELSELADLATDNEVSSLKLFNDMIKRAMPLFMDQYDRWVHQDGTALIGQATAHSVVSGKSVYSMNTNTGMKLMTRGQYPTVYNNAFDTILTAGMLFVDSVNWTDRTIRLSGTVPGAAATDKFAFEGVSGATPAGIKGLKYWISGATSGTTAGVNRANEFEIVSSVDASGGTFTHEKALLMQHKMLSRRRDKKLDLVALTPLGQQARIISNIMSIQSIDIGTTSARMIDRMPDLKGKEFFPIAGIPHYIDLNEDEDRIDYIAPKTWGRAILHPVGYAETRGGQRFYTLMGGSGAPAAGTWFGLRALEQPYCTDPGAQGAITGLSIPTGYPVG